MADKPTFRIDGAAFHDLDGFFDEVERQLLDGASWDRNVESLSDVFRADAIDPPRAYRLVWEHSDLSRRRLGSMGPGSFDAVVEMLSTNPSIELVLS